MGLSHAYGAPLERNEAVQRIRWVFDCGYTFFDTAEVYAGQFPDGTISMNEEILGEAIQPIRDMVVIASKGGVDLDASHKITPKGSPAALRKSLEQSLKRLRVDVIDLYYQHRIDPAVEPETVAGAMRDFIREGKIRFRGVSNASDDYIRRANSICPMAAVQLRYSMLAHWNERFFRF